MPIKLLFAALAVFAGVAGALQSAANAGLAQKIGLGAALVMNTGIVLVLTLVVFVARGPHVDFYPSGTPWSLYIGGVCGFIVVFTLAVVFPAIGAALAIALLVLGQSVAALVIDHYGLMGMAPNPVTFSRLVGLALVAGGVAVLRL